MSFIKTNKQIRQTLRDTKENCQNCVVFGIYLSDIPSFDCYQTVTNQQVTYIQQPQHAFAGGHGGVVIIQPTGAVATTTHGYPVAGQPAMYLPQQVRNFHY